MPFRVGFTGRPDEGHLVPNLREPARTSPVGDTSVSAEAARRRGTNDFCVQKVPTRTRDGDCSPTGTGLGGEQGATVADVYR